MSLIDKLIFIKYYLDMSFDFVSLVFLSIKKFADSIQFASKQLGATGGQGSLGSHSKFASPSLSIVGSEGWPVKDAKRSGCYDTQWLEQSAGSL